MSAERLGMYQIRGPTLKIIVHTMDSRQEPKTIQKACQLVAKKIGREWPRLYLVLPMKPEREHTKRQKDIQQLTDARILRCDRTLSGDARAALARWMLLYHQADLNDLIAALEAAGWLQLATDIRRRWQKSTGVGEENVSGQTETFGQTKGQLASEMKESTKRPSEQKYPNEADNLGNTAKSQDVNQENSPTPLHLMRSSLIKSNSRQAITSEE
ncbi:unnamed protein product [Protopolystoma xenopodis]|uniref:Death domain-containing protein n=1 Tax=Protopolystoma xenopodis TaxID=117903 RepID=A0A3S5B3I6_9PLAT|nr:unnamed protein product [Protopolystoma xenopodis]